MSVLDFNKPEKIRPTDEHNKMHSSDSGIDGTYVSNMSDADKEKWKATHIKRGEDPRIEIRKTFSYSNGLGWKEEGAFSVYAQVLIVVRPPTNTMMPNVVMSANGKIPFDVQTYAEFQQAIEEAKIILI